jgi:glutathione synthase/RimK-type ligase-like ATP-grasp enzyme
METEKKFNPEKNYVYFQDFIPQNDFDIRIIVIGKRAFAIKRMVRKGDFRASGSGNIKYDPYFSFMMDFPMYY